MDQTQRDYKAKSLALQITTLTRIYMREVDDLIHQRDLRGARSREEQFETEILDACQVMMALVRESVQDGPTRNSEQLASFTAYCRYNPDQRFWQAARNWGGFAHLYHSDVFPMNAPPEFKDTFNIEGQYVVAPLGHRYPSPSRPPDQRLCLSLRSLGQQCVLPLGHAGPHGGSNG